MRRPLPAHFVLVFFAIKYHITQLPIGSCAGSAGSDCKHFLITNMRAKDIYIENLLVAKRQLYQKFIARHSRNRKEFPLCRIGVI